MTMKSTCLGLLSALVLCCLAGAAATAGDIPANPPVKMGLWESTIVSNIGGLAIPPDVAARLQAIGAPRAQEATRARHAVLHDER